MTVSSYVESIVGREVMTFDNCSLLLQLWTQSLGAHGTQVAGINAAVVYGSVIKKVNPF